MDFNAAIFDLDGTILDSMDVWEHIDIQFLKKRNLPVPENYVTEICARSFEEAAQYTIHITICVNYNQHNRSAAQKNPVNKICLLLVFSVPTERAAIATGNDLRGLGICHQQAFSRNSGNGISAKYAILRKIALLASSFKSLWQRICLQLPH